MLDYSRLTLETSKFGIFKYTYYKVMFSYSIVFCQGGYLYEVDRLDLSFPNDELDMLHHKTDHLITI